MNPSQAIEKARQELASALPEGRTTTRRKFVWQTLEEPHWTVRLSPPPDNRPYYRVEITGGKTNGNPEFTSKVESFNRPDHVRATIWDRLLGPSDPPSS
jgi:hypothetical protein